MDIQDSKKQQILCFLFELHHRNVKCRFDNQLTRGTEVANVVTALCLQTPSHVAPVNMQHCRFDNQLTEGTEVANVVTAVCLQTLSHVINRTKIGHHQQHV